MRRIKSRDQVERERSRNIKMMSFFMLVVLIFGTVGYAFSSFIGDDSNDSGDLGDYDDGSSVRFGNDLIRLSTPRLEIEEINVVTFKTVNDYLNKPLYLDVGDNLIFSEIQSTLGIYASRTQEACYENCEGDIVKKDCSENLVVFTESEENLAYQQENCVFIEGDLGAVDAFLYKTFGQ
jgi:hypothetical protein